jgi:hypothetical protein
MNLKENCAHERDMNKFLLDYPPAWFLRRWVVMMPKLNYAQPRTTSLSELVPDDPLFIALA